MSTRRARIKAVTSLPPRRKNIDVGDKKTKPKEKDNAQTVKSPKDVTAKSQEVEKDNAETVKSPKDVTAKSQKVGNSPVIKPSTPANIAENVTAITSVKVPTPVEITTPGVVSQANNAIQKDASGTNKNSDIPDDYSVPSVPSVTEEAIMDGIILLQPANSAPKPIDLLKNDIISDHAEVQFDPIIPLPSPSKVRPKLRPVPRLAPLRRNSVQGSASESEDESRRALHSGGPGTPSQRRDNSQLSQLLAMPMREPNRIRNDSFTNRIRTESLSSIKRNEPAASKLKVEVTVNRVRNDSVSSSVSQATLQQAALSPVKEKQSKQRRLEAHRRMAAMRRRRETVRTEALTMYDLIFYNPTENPIIPDEDEIKAKEANAKEAERKAKESSEEDEPPANDAAPVPQIKLGPNGEIILDQQSLVIKQTDSQRKVSATVREGSWGGGGVYRRHARTADWGADETVRFYRALAAIGTDFTLMQPLFPTRTRRDLKVKFKKEERLNGAQVDKALRSATTWDAAQLQEDFTAERIEAEEKARREKERREQDKLLEKERMKAAKQLKMRISKGAKAVESVPQTTECVTADDFIKRAIEDKAASRKRKATKPTKIAQPAEPKQNHIPPINIPIQINHVPNKNGDTTIPPQVTSLPGNIETGSLVVLTVADPKSPSKKMLQTYIADGGGKLTPVAIPPSFLSSVVSYMKKGTPKTPGSPMTSPNSVASAESRASVTPNVVISPVKRQRHSSYTITQL